ncbi:MAG: 16S rRNA (cytosine(1402)-N(4))-methyltransferase RsmH [Bacteroidota bacterium]
MYHRPVLLEASIDLMAVIPGGTYVDVTFGGGGHSRKILDLLGSDGRLIAFDRDPDARANAWEDDRLTIIPQDFRHIKRELHSRGISEVDGILGDLGVSSHQFDEPGRGFSFRFEAPLDMRMNPDEELTAAELLNTANEKRLLGIFREFGELSNAKQVADRVLRFRAEKEIQTTGHLEDALKDCIPAKRRSKFLAQVYQALRIEVNHEMEALQALLESSLGLLKPGGRLVVISYHSLEDRFVKRFMKTGNLAGLVEKDFYGKILTPWKQVTRKAIQPPDAEVHDNPRARSARLRAAEKINHPNS